MPATFYQDRLRKEVQTLRTKGRLGATEALLVSESFFQRLHSELGPNYKIFKDEHTQDYFLIFEGIKIRKFTKMEGEFILPYTAPAHRQ